MMTSRNIRITCLLAIILFKIDLTEKRLAVKNYKLKLLMLKLYFEITLKLNSKIRANTYLFEAKIRF